MSIAQQSLALSAGREDEGEEKYKQWEETNTNKNKMQCSIKKNEHLNWLSMQ